MVIEIKNLVYALNNLVYFKIFLSFLFFYKFIYFIYLLLAALGLRCCVRAFL